jgi:hypothetical protein
MENIFIPTTQGSTPGLMQNKGDAYCFFFYREGIVHHKYAAHAQTVNQQFYLKVDIFVWCSLP